MTTHDVRATFTPGHWHVAGDGYDTATYVMGRDVLVRDGKEDRIIAVCHSYRAQDRIARLHNANLIAAAPDLYRELRGARCPRPFNNRADEFEVGQCVDAGECGCSLGAAIAKADGRS